MERNENSFCRVSARFAAIGQLVIVNFGEDVSEMFGYPGNHRVPVPRGSPWGPGRGGENIFKILPRCISAAMDATERYFLVLYFV